LVDARDDLEQRLESLFDRDLFEIAKRRVEKRVKAVTWDAFRLTALEGLPGLAVSQRLQIPVAHVFVARNDTPTRVGDTGNQSPEGACNG
jgi:hypothetical protein